MIINGMQKLTLLDFPERVACTLFTAGCNLRCPFCHNASLVTDIGEALDTADILAMLKKRQGLLDGVCISGGEPTLQPDLAEFIAAVRDMGYAVKLDTNGTHPDRLAPLLQAGLLDYVAMDIKNSRKKYPLTVGTSDFDTAVVDESIALLRQSGVAHEFRTTVVRELHTVEDIVAIARWVGDGAKCGERERENRIAGTARGAAEKLFLQQFVDSGDLIGEGLSAHEPATLHAMRDAAAQYVVCEVRGI